MVAGATYTIDTCGSPTDTNLTIYDPSNVQVGFNETGTCGDDASVTFVAATSGTYKAQLGWNGGCTANNQNHHVNITLVSSPAPAFSGRIATAGEREGRAYESNAMWSTRLSDDKVLLFYKDDNDFNTNNLRAVIGTTSGSNITFGTEVIIATTDINNYVKVEALSPTKAVAIWEVDDPSNLNALTYSVIDIDGTTITANPSAQISNTKYERSWNEGFELTAINDSQVVLAWDDQITYNGAAVIAGNVSGSTITWGAPINPSAAASTLIDITRVSDSKFAMVYGDGHPAEDGYVVAGTIDASASIFIGTPELFEFVADDVDDIRIVALSETEVAIAYEQAPTDQGHLIYATLSGTDFTFPGSIANFYTGGGISTFSMSALSATEVIIAVDSGSGIISSEYFTALLASNDFTVSSGSDIVTGGQAEDVSINALTSDVAIVAYIDDRDLTSPPNANTDEIEVLVLTLPSGSNPEINVQGNATNIILGNVSPGSGDHTDFGTGASLSRTFTIQNLGAGTLNLGSNAVSISGIDAADFSVNTQPSATVAGMSSVTFIIDFSSAVASTRQAEIHINSNDVHEPDYFFSIAAVGESSCTDPDIPTVLTATPSTTCSGSTSTLTWTGALNDAIQWHIYTGSCGGTQVGTSATNSFTTAALTANTTFYIRGEDGAGCVDEASGLCGEIIVNVNALPIVTFTALADLCIDSGVQTGLGSGTATGGTYSGTGVTDDANGMTYSFDPAAAGVGTHTITYTAITTGCTDSANDDVEVFALPMVTFTALADLCLDSGVQTGLGGGAPTGGIFYSGPGVTDNGNGMTYDFDPASAGVGVHTLTYTFAAGIGCSNSATDDVEVFALPAATFTVSNIDGCTGSDVTITPVGASGGATQFWAETFDQDGAGVIGVCSGADPTTCATNIAPTNGQWSVSGTTSGITATTDSFNVNGGQLVGRDVDGEVCFLSESIDISTYTSVDFSALIEEQGDLETADYADVTLIIDGMPTLITDWMSMGSATHTLTGDLPDDSDWVSTTVTQTGITGTTLQIQICVYNGASTEYISMDNITLTGTSTTAFNFYDADPASGTANLLAGSVASYNPMTTTVTSPQTVYVAEDSSPCDSQALPVIITVNALPTASIITSGTALEYCAGTPNVTLTATNAGATASYLWSNGDTGISTSSVLTTLGNPYSVTVTDNGCSATSGTVNLIENAVPTASIITSGTALEYCAGTPNVTLTATNAGATASYLWSNGDTGISTSSVLTTLGNPYSVTVTDNGCSATSGTVNLIENAVPAASIITSGTALEYCAGTPNVTLTATNAGATASYLWSNGDTGISTSSVLTTLGNPYSVTVTDNGCSATSGTVNLIENALPTVTFTALADVCIDSGVQNNVGGGLATGGVY
ncbi:beta strand repeat-containing protein [Lacinutrix jangbogonensis]|uniref:beta strand repeat-containing protein n=1 Tax=Lacinutrix jangbogonensis TaxID=1469557 RepID=UPI00053D2BDC|nr:choice-of-anchor D domain-containing protein [Lacinutrix jangbogonensis]